MSDTVRQSVLRSLVAAFLAGNFLLAAVLWRPAPNRVLCMAACGALVAEPMLLAMWFGLDRQAIARRLGTAIGLSILGAATYDSGVLLSERFMESRAIAISALFVVSGVGATLLAGGILRAHRFLTGVLTIEDECSGPAPAIEEPTQLAGLQEELVSSDSPAATYATEPSESSVSSPFDDDSLEASSASPRSPSPGELQFGAGYIVAMTSLFAIVLSLLRLVAQLSSDPKWSILFLFGWTFFFYSLFAALLVMLSVLTTRRRRLLALLSVAYTMLAPLAALATLSMFGTSGVELFAPPYLANLYAYALSLAATVALVTGILRRLGYRLRHGWL